MTFSTLDSLKLVDLVGFANLSTKNRCSELFCSDKSLISKTFFWKIRGKKSDPFLEKNTWCLVEKSLQDQISKSISETCWFSALLNWRFACLFQTYALILSPDFSLKHHKPYPFTWQQVNRRLCNKIGCSNRVPTKNAGKHRGSQKKTY